MQKIPGMEDLYSLGTKIGSTVSGLFFGCDDMQVEYKADSTPVTIADKTVYKLVGEWRNALFPDLAIVSEEGHKGTLTGDLEQYHLRMDEIDGTATYVEGMPAFSSLLALIRGGEVVTSVIVDPIGRRVYSAEKGKGAYCNKKLIKVQQKLPTTPTIGVVSWPRRDQHNMLVHHMLCGALINESVVGELHEMGFAVQDCPSIGYFDAFVASGTISATIFPGPTIHDTAAGDLLVREADGIATDLLGNPLVYSGPYVYGQICASPAIYRDVLGVVRRALECQEEEGLNPLLSWKF